MADTWKTVRVFISSTFRDMHAERDHLVKVVFPALRERLEKHRVHLIDIDLRWGVTREQAENDQALDLCLQQIDECRPFFIGILGERYGYVPTKARDWTHTLYGWVQHHTGKSITELEFVYGVLRDPKMKGRAFFYFRDPAATATIPKANRSAFVEDDPTSIENLTALKETVRQSGCPLMDGYPARWDPAAFDRPTKSHGRLTGLKEFGERVLGELWEAIKVEHGLPDTPADSALADPLAEEKDYHKRFMESRLRVYVGREQINNELFTFADGNDLAPCLVTGPSGSGKSAVLARFVTTYASKHKQVIEDGRILVIPHFVGASPRSTNLRDMLRRFCHVLKASFGFAEDVPEEVAKLSVTFREFIGRIPTDTRVLLVIDALNQLDESDRAQELYWLPIELPPQIKVIVSCISDSSKTEPVLEAFRSRKHRPVQLPALSDAEQRLIIRQVPSQSAKTLDDHQVNLLLSNPATANPLFLLVALEELRGFAPYEQLNERIAAFPREGDTVTAIFTQVIERLVEDFNPKLVETVLTLLASARRGLSERELQELVAGLDGAEDLFPVLRQLRPYLLGRAGLIDFYHRNLFKAVREAYLPSEEPQRQAHMRLAEYFSTADMARKIEEYPWQLAWSNQWQRLADVLGESEFFAAAWRRAPFEVRELWTLVETHVSGAMVKAYQHVIAAPDQHHAIARDIAMLLALTGNLDQAQSLREYLVGAAKSAGEPREVSRALLQNANVHWSRGELQEAQRLLDAAERVNLQIQDVQGLAMVWGNQAAILEKRGQWRQALELFERQKQICQTAGDMNGLQVAIGGIAAVLAEYGSRGEALDLFRERARLCREVNNLDGLATALVSQSSILSRHGTAEEAMSLCREAEAICRRVQNRERLLTCLATRVQMHLKRGEWENAEEAVAEHEAIGEAMGSRAGLMQSLSLQADIAKAKSDWPRALELSDRCLRLCGDAGDAGWAADAQHDRATILYALGRWNDAAALHMAAIESARRNDQARLLAKHLHGLAGIRRNHGAPREAAQLWQQALQIYERLEDRSGQAFSLTHQARLLCDLGRHQASLAPLQRAESLYREVNDLEGLVECFGVLGIVYRELDQTRQALDYFGRQKEVALSIKNSRGVCGAISGEGLVLLDLRRWEEANERFEECVAMCRAENDLHYLQSNLGNQAIAATQLEDFPKALRLHEEEEKICRQLGDPKNLYLCLIEKAKVLLWLNDADRALDVYAEAVELSRRLQPPLYLVQALFERAETFLRYKQDPPSAGPLLREARAVAARLPPNAWLDPIEQALRRCP